MTSKNLLLIQFLRFYSSYLVKKFIYILHKFIIIYFSSSIIQTELTWGWSQESIWVGMCCAQVKLTSFWVSTFWMWIDLGGLCPLIGWLTSSSNMDLDSLVQKWRLTHMSWPKYDRVSRAYPCKWSKIGFHAISKCFILFNIFKNSTKSHITTCAIKRSPSRIAMTHNRWEQTTLKFNVFCSNNWEKATFCSELDTEATLYLRKTSHWSLKFWESIVQLTLKRQFEILFFLKKNRKITQKSHQFEIRRISNFFTELTHSKVSLSFEIFSRSIEEHDMIQ